MSEIKAEKITEVTKEGLITYDVPAKAASTETVELNSIKEQQDNDTRRLTSLHDEIAMLQGQLPELEARMTEREAVINKAEMEIEKLSPANDVEEISVTEEPL